ncbi:MAG: FtsX-like permease family protein [Bacilli bacterium]|jgi:ABC-type antimicrobial peptide transport system permease subunit
MVNKVTTNRLLNRKMFRELKNGWKQFFAIIFIAALAVTLYTGLSANSLSLEKRVNELYEGGNIADIWTTVTSYNRYDEYCIDRIAGENSKTERRFTASAKLNGLNATALIYETFPTINRPYSLESDQSNDFFILDKSLQDRSIFEFDAPVEIGARSTISLATSSFLTAFDINSEELATIDQYAKGNNDEEKRTNNIFRQDYISLKFTISGLMVSPENVQRGTFNSSSFLLSTDYFKSNFLLLAKDHFTDDGYNLIEYFINEYMFVNQYCTKLPKGENVSDVRSEIEEYFNQSKTNTRLIYTVDIDKLPSNAIIQSDIVQAKQLTYIFPMVFFLVAVLVILTTLSQIILKERTQIGTMKALGLSKAQIFVHYAFLSMFVCSIGIAFGLIIGPLLLPSIMGIKYGILYSLPAMTYTFPFFDVLICVAAFLGVACLVTFLVARKETRLNPAESMRPPAPKAYKAIKMAKLEGISRNHMSVKMAFRNIRASFVKSMMVIIGIAGCTALLVCGHGVEDTLNYGIELDMSKFYCSDLYVTYSAGSGSLIDKITNIQFDDDSGNQVTNSVTKAEEYTVLPIALNSGETIINTYVYGLEGNHQFFKREFDETTIGMSNKIASELGVKTGDEVSFTAVGKTYSGVIGATFDQFSVHGIFVCVSDAKFASIGQTKTNCWVDIDQNSASDDKVAGAISQIAGVSSAETRTEMSTKITSIMSSVAYMTGSIKIFAIFLAVVVLYNLALLNYRERVRDIATLRVLGFSKAEIARSLVLEIMFLTVIGIAIGMVLGKPMEILVLIVNRTPLVDFLYQTNLVSYIISFAITFGTALVVNIALSALTGKVKMVESLKSVE